MEYDGKPLPYILIADREKPGVPHLRHARSRYSDDHQRHRM